MNMCQVDDESKTFRCRSFLIRYRDEIHELNDGCHWRLTVPAVNVLNLTGRQPTCTNHLVFKFKLVCYDLGADASAQALASLDSDEMEWKVVGEQTLQIQNATSGWHEYFPVMHYFSVIVSKFRRFNLTIIITAFVSRCGSIANILLTWIA